VTDRLSILRNGDLQRARRSRLAGGSAATRCRSGGGWVVTRARSGGGCRETRHGVDGEQRSIGLRIVVHWRAKSRGLGCDAMLNRRLLVGEAGMERGGMGGESAPGRDRLGTYSMARQVIEDFKQPGLSNRLRIGRQNRGRFGHVPEKKKFLKKKKNQSWGGQGAYYIVPPVIVATVKIK
jgi:hypothetical protein